MFKKKKKIILTPDQIVDTFEYRCKLVCRQGSWSCHVEVRSPSLPREPYGDKNGWQSLRTAMEKLGYDRIDDYMAEVCDIGKSKSEVAAKACLLIQRVRLQVKNYSLWDYSEPESQYITEAMCLSEVPN